MSKQPAARPASVPKQNIQSHQTKDTMNLKVPENRQDIEARKKKEAKKQKAKKQAETAHVLSVIIEIMVILLLIAVIAVLSYFIWSIVRPAFL